MSHPIQPDGAAWLVCSCAFWLAVLAIVPRIDGGWVLSCSLPLGPLADSENMLRRALGVNGPPAHQTVY